MDKREKELGKNEIVQQAAKKTDDESKKRYLMFYFNCFAHFKFNLFDTKEIQMGSTSTKRRCDTTTINRHKINRINNNKYNWHQRYSDISIWFIAQKAKAMTVLNLNLFLSKNKTLN